MKKSVLLTGATGFVGRNLLPLLVQRGYHVYALVRPKLGKTPEERLSQMLEGTDSSNVTTQDVTLIEGDLTEELAGISQANLETMRGKIDFVVHSAAMVRFDEDLAEETYNVNVGGTTRMIEVANQVATPKFYYISTAYTLGKKNFGEEVLHPVEGPFSNPYERSKCKCEHLVREAADRGDFQAAIFRPAAIIGDSRTGAADTSISLYGIIKVLRVFARKMSKAGKTNASSRVNADPSATLNLVPVDYVCEAIVTGIEQQVEDGIYHITNSTPPSAQEVLAYISQNLGMRKDFVNFVKGVTPEELDEDEKYLDSLLETFKAYLNKNARFDDSQMSALLAQHGRPPFEVTEDMVKFIIGVHMGVRVGQRAEVRPTAIQGLSQHVGLTTAFGLIPEEDQEWIEDMVVELVEEMATVEEPPLELP